MPSLATPLEATWHSSPGSIPSQSQRSLWRCTPSPTLSARFFCQDEIDCSNEIYATAIRRFLNPNAPVILNSQGTDRDKLYHWVLSEGNYANLLGFNQYSDSENDSWRISKRFPAGGLPPTFVGGLIAGGLIVGGLIDAGV
jgi:hypothetical protein